MHRQRSKRAQRIRFFLLYTLVPLFIACVVTVLTMYIIGWRFNPTDNTLEQGGLLQLASVPSGATVTVDGTEVRGTTTTRYDASAGTHNVTMALDGYMPWQKTASVNPAQVVWLNYARLVPETINTAQVARFKTVDDSIASTQGRYMLVLPDNTKPNIVRVAASTGTATQTALAVPSAAYTKVNGGTFSLESLSDSGKSALIRYGTSASSQWIVLRLDAPETSKQLALSSQKNISDAMFVASKDDEVYALSGGSLLRVNVTQSSESGALAEQVASFRQNRDGIVTYVSKSTGGDRKVGYYTPGAARSRELRTLQDSTSATIDAAVLTYSHGTYVALLHDKSLEITKVSLPASDSSNDITSVDVADLAIKSGKHTLSISPSERFVMTRYGSEVTNYDLETNEIAPITLSGKNAKAVTLQWVDDFYMVSDGDATLRLLEFDGTNNHAIAKTMPGQAVVFSNRGQFLYYLRADDDGVALMRAQMIL